MGQKSSFKASQTGTFIQRNTFPIIPGTYIKNPKILKTKRGALLISGCWGVLRKPSELFLTCSARVRSDGAILDYSADWIQGVCWALAAGTGSKIPYFYPAFHLTMLLHRNVRDNAR